MSLIVHDCARCGVAETHHGGSDLRVCPGSTETKPRVMPTWKADGSGAPVETLVKPGETTRQFGHMSLTTCGCPDCHALFTVLNGIARVA